MLGTQVLEYSYFFKDSRLIVRNPWSKMNIVDSGGPGYCDSNPELDSVLYKSYNYKYSIRDINSKYDSTL